MKKALMVIVFLTPLCMLFPPLSFADAPANYTWTGAPGGSFTASSVDFEA